MRRAGENGSGPTLETPGSCPSSEQLAGLVEGMLLPDESATIEEHLGGCTRCRQDVATLRAVVETTESRTDERRPGPWLTRSWIPRAAVAASIALALLWWMAGRSVTPGRIDLAAPIDSIDLGEAVRELTVRAPELFEDARLQVPWVPPDGYMRGDENVQLEQPLEEEVLLTSRPSFTWRNHKFLAQGRLLVQSSDLTKTLLSIPLAESHRGVGEHSVELPDGAESLSAGESYVWTLEFTPLGEKDDSQTGAFAIVDARRADLYQRRIATIDDLVSHQPLAEILKALVAIRAGIFQEAAIHARRAAESGDTRGSEILVRLGLERPD